MLRLQNVNESQRRIREVHVSHVIPGFWYRIEHDPIRSKFQYAKAQIPRKFEIMAAQVHTKSSTLGQSKAHMQLPIGH